MSRQFAPKHILKKTLISKAEYKFREEWDPETVKDYQVSPNEPASAAQVQQQQQAPRTINPANVQSRMPTRRSQARSSSLFEEWKAQALRSPDKVKGSDASSSVTTKGNNNKNEESTAPVEARGPLGEHSDKTVNTQVKTKPTNGGRGQQPEANKTGSVSTETHPPASAANNTNDPVANPTATTKKKNTKRGRANTRQSGRERPQFSREREPEPPAYTSPNGTRLSKDELRKSALGVRLEGDLKVYFLPCFIEDPWKGLQPVPAIPITYY
ncbi:hypothetical protein BDV12DRAFT_194888 [Aspergillus spectabilis]